MMDSAESDASRPAVLLKAIQVPETQTHKKKNLSEEGNGGYNLNMNMDSNTTLLLEGDIIYTCNNQYFTVCMQFGKDAELKSV